VDGLPWKHWPPREQVIQHIVNQRLDTQAHQGHAMQAIV
jgi:hypothetical protein